jgi:hypothetical protein
MTNHARTGGILTIVAGAFGFLGLLWMLASIFMMRVMLSPQYTPYGFPFPTELITIITIFYSIIGIFFVLIGILGIVGGVFALRKKHWGVALAGAIAGSITFFPCGIPAIIFVTLAKPEFSARKSSRRRRR